MKIIKILSIFLPLTLLISCAATNDQSGEETDPGARSLLGQVKGDYYFAPDKAFSVSMPHPPSVSRDEMYESMHTQIRELDNDDLVSVTFGPAAVDHNEYRISLSKRPMRGDQERFVRDLFARKLAQRKGSFREHLFEKTDVNGKPHFYAVYDNQTSYLVISASSVGDNYMTIEADVFIGPLFKSEPLDSLLKKQWQRFNRLQTSFSAPAMALPEKP
ncbi:MAG: hypothetical protein OEW58_11460 [Gammaproteobacteria bacterium]|nr:hypothetical protein [Gammaproteobacteria bacterium]